MPSAILQELETYGPTDCPQLTYEQAADYTRHLAKTHYENFSVVSWMLPRHLRDDFRHVYAFCRWADDLGDETGDPRRSLELLAWWREELDRCYEGSPRHPVYVALQRTIERHEIPRKPFDDLISAFVQDQTVTRYDTWDQVCGYCTGSADPVGRLVLYVCGYGDDERQRLSDRTCTALQLANFWQDVRRDVIDRDRVYMPADVASAHGLDIETMVEIIRRDPSGVNVDAMQPIRDAYRATMRDLVQRTWAMFDEGRGLWPLVRPEVRVDVQLFSLGGESILRMIESQDFDTLSQRPKLSRGAKFGLMMRAIAGKLHARLLRGEPS